MAENIKKQNAKEQTEKENKQNVSEKKQANVAKKSNTSSKKQSTSTNKQAGTVKKADTQAKKQIESKDKQTKNVKKVDTQAKNQIDTVKKTSERKATGKNVAVSRRSTTNKKAEKSLEESVEEVIEQVEYVTEKNKLVDPASLKVMELDQIKKELKDSKKATKSNINRKMKLNEIFKNALILIFIELYFVVLMLSSKTANIIEVISDLKLIGIIEVIMAIILFEKAYKKDNGKIGLHGVEMCMLGISTILILNFIAIQIDFLNIIVATILGIFILYYAIKMFVIAIKKKK